MNQNGSGGSGWKMVCGCIAVVAIGGMLVCGGILVFVVPMIYRTAVETVEQETGRNNFANNWEAPKGDPTPEELFPESVGDYALITSDSDAKFDEYDIDQEGLFAAYAGPSTTIEVRAYQVTDSEKESLFASVERTIDQKSYSYSVVFGGAAMNRFTFNVSPPQSRGIVWYSKGWIFFFVTESEEDMWPFLEDLLAQVKKFAQSQPSDDAIIINDEE